jgi:hypothetical protein
VGLDYDILGGDGKDCGDKGVYEHGIDEGGYDE